MNIKFLGTSFGAPSKRRHQQSLLVETGDNAYLIDAGAPVLDILVNSSYDLTKIKAIFISHLHGDHMNGLFDILNLADYYKMNLSVYLSEQMGIDLFENYCMIQKNGYRSDSVSFKLIEDGYFYDDGVLKIKSIQTAHMENHQKPSYGFLLENDKSKVYITGDLHKSLKDFPGFLYSEFVDMIITECAHFTAEDLFEKLKRCKTDLAAVIHVSPNEKYEDLINYSKNTELKVVFPNDNDEYKLQEEKMRILFLGTGAADWP